MPLELGGRAGSHDTFRGSDASGTSDLSLNTMEIAH